MIHCDYIYVYVCINRYTHVQKVVDHLPCYRKYSKKMGHPGFGSILMPTVILQF